MCGPINSLQRQRTKAASLRPPVIPGPFCIAQSKATSQREKKPRVIIGINIAFFINVLSLCFSRAHSDFVQAESDMNQKHQDNGDPVVKLREDNTLTHSARYPCLRVSRDPVRTSERQLSHRSRLNRQCHQIFCARDDARSTSHKRGPASSSSIVQYLADSWSSRRAPHSGCIRFCPTLVVLSGHADRAQSPD